MDGHGTFYKFCKEHFPENLLDAKSGDRVSVVLYNLHTDQLDEVVFELEGCSKINDNYISISGYIADIEGCFRIKIDYYPDRPLESHILVFASAPSDYSYSLNL